MPKKRRFTDLDFASADESSEDTTAPLLTAATPSPSSSNSTQRKGESPSKKTKKSSALLSIPKQPTRVLLGRLKLSFKSSHRRSFCQNNGIVVTHYDDRGDGQEWRVFSHSPGISRSKQGCCTSMILCDGRYSLLLETNNRRDPNAIAIYAHRPSITDYDSCNRHGSKKKELRSGNTVTTKGLLIVKPTADVKRSMRNRRDHSAQPSTKKRSEVSTSTNSSSSSSVKSRSTSVFSMGDDGSWPEHCDRVANNPKVMMIGPKTLKREFPRRDRLGYVPKELSMLLRGEIERGSIMIEQNHDESNKAMQPECEIVLDVFRPSINDLMDPYTSIPPDFTSLVSTIPTVNPKFMDLLITD